MTTSVDGVEIAVEHRGHGTRLVCTTGWANERTVWSTLADNLATDHAVTTWDLRGHGGSGTPPPGSYSRQHALGDLAAVLDEASAATSHWPTRSTAPTTWSPWC